MKTITKIFMLLFTLSLFTACDKVDELTEFDVNETYKTSVAVSVPEDPDQNPQTFSYTSAINIAENSDINDNYGDIESIVIHELYLEIKDFSGNEEAVVDDVTISLGSTVVNLGSVNLAGADAANQKINIGTSQQWGSIANALKNQATMNVGISGTVDKTPVDFIAEFTLRLTVTIDAI